jgi:hypothetical protein
MGTTKAKSNPLVLHSWGFHDRAALINEARLTGWESARPFFCFCEGRADGLLHANKINRYQIPNTVIPAYHLILEPFDEWEDNTGRHWCYEFDPVGGKARCKEGNRKNESVETAHPGINLYHLAIRDNIWPSNIKVQTGGSWLPQASDEVGNVILNIDRLRKCVNPPGSHL